MACAETANPGPVAESELPKQDESLFNSPDGQFLAFARRSKTFPVERNSYNRYLLVAPVFNHLRTAQGLH